MNIARALMMKEHPTTTTLAKKKEEDVASMWKTLHLRL